MDGAQGLFVPALATAARARRGGSHGAVFNFENQGTKWGTSPLDFIFPHAVSLGNMKTGTVAGFQFRFLNSAKNSLSSVRLLLTNGFDHEAKIQLRFLRELMVAWVYFEANPLAQIDFKKPKNFQEANYFWYQHLRRAEKELKKLNAGTDAFHPHMDQKLIDIEKVLDAAAGLESMCLRLLIFTVTTTQSHFKL